LDALDSAVALGRFGHGCITSGTGFSIGQGSVGPEAQGISQGLLARARLVTTVNIEQGD
jgi:hypothetical protein